MAQKYFLLILFVCVLLLLIKDVHTQQSDVTVRISNMTQSMTQDAIRITKEAFIKFNGYTVKSRSSIAKYIHYQFDHLHKPSWQCIIGRDFALSIASENEKRIILDVGKITVLIFKGKC
ncbi:unnamed protein product [Rotaria sordida]|uniref:Dynein light chain n=1 Tax=Rotaria sordida TaxID=392033 RepID=A0A814Z1W6_9BILA|nr:unnamed protein product [Rotaria sordida]CAF3721896.1 unnamed protein product [Rotaria sordida]